MEGESTFKGTMPRIFLIGMMGAGKSFTGRQLAERLNYAFVDTDELVMAQEGSIGNIFKSQGEDAFRKMETAVLKTCMTMDRTVIATGGGLPCRLDNLDDMLMNGVVIYLKASVETLNARLKADNTNRPLLSDKSSMRVRQIESLMLQRNPCYLRAHFTLDTDDLDSKGVVDQIIRLIGDGIM